MALQWERAAVSLSIFLDAKSGKTTNLAKEYAETDKALRETKWRRFGPEKIFENNLRFQIRLDDFRNYVYASSGIKSGEQSSGEDAISQRRNEGAGRRNDGSGSDIQDAVQVLATGWDGVRLRVRMAMISRMDLTTHF